MSEAKQDLCQSGCTTPFPGDDLKKSQEPPLHRAARLGLNEDVRRLIQDGTEVNAVVDLSADPDDWSRSVTPLMSAAGSGDGATAETVRLLLELGADPKIKIDGETAATLACTGLGWGFKPGGDAERLRVLIEAGSPLPEEPKYANQLLCEVASLGDPERLGVLLARGIDPKGFFDPEEARRAHLEWRARSSEFGEELDALFSSMPAEMRAEMDASRAASDAEDLRRAVSAPWGHEIPLFCASKSGNVECVRALLRAGAEAAARDESSESALFCSGSAEVARVLMEAGLSLEEGNWYGWSPLVDAVHSEDSVRRTRALIEVGANVNATHDRGYTVFMSAVGSGRRLEVLHMLIAAGANPHAVSEPGYNAFHAAIDVNGEANAEESVRETFGYLRELGVDIEYRNKLGQTPLARAIDCGTGIEVRVLCEIGADPNVIAPVRRCGGGGCSMVEAPLLFHAASAAVAADEKVRALLLAGANPVAKDHEGHTALVRAVADLCLESDDYPGSFTAFFEGLKGLTLAGVAAPRERERFVEATLTVLRAYIEAFALKIPLPDLSEYSEPHRKMEVACIAWLAAYEIWERRQRAQPDSTTKDET